jgi:Ca2+-binding RTX toxin-like protein/streptogramin lyase
MKTVALRRSALAGLAATCAALAAAPAAPAATISPGDLLAVSDTNAVLQIDPADGGQATFASGGSLANPSGVAVAANGDILVTDADAFGGSGGVLRIDPATGAQATVSSGGSFTDPSGLALEADGDILVVERGPVSQPGGIVRVDPVTGTQTVVSWGGSFVEPVGIAVEPGGDILVADLFAVPGSGAIIRVDPATGAQTVVSSGGSFDDPYGLAVEADGDVLVADVWAEAVFRVDPATGAQSTVSSGGALASPFSVALAPGGEILVGGAGGVVALDPVTGAQTTVSSGAPGLLSLAVSTVMSHSIPKGSGADGVLLMRDGDRLVLFDSALNVVAAGPVALANAAVIQGAGGQGDALEIDYRQFAATPTGGFFGLPGGIRFRAGSGGLDVLAVTGDADFTLTNSALTSPPYATVRIASVEGARLFAGAGSNTVDASGFSGPTQLNGADGDDFLRGGSAGDTLHGGPGADFYTGGLGDDTFLGAAGDTLIESGDVDFTLSDSRMTGRGTDAVSGIDRASLTGGAGANAFTLTGWRGSAALTGLEGPDRVAAGGNFDMTLTDAELARAGRGAVELLSIEQAALTGGVGANELDASAFSGPVTLSGRAGDDRLAGGASTDALDGGAGDDALESGTGTGARLTGSTGDDTITGGPGIDVLAEAGDVDFRLADGGLTGLGIDSLSAIEEAELRGGASGNTFTVNGWTRPARLFGGSGIGDRVVSVNDADMALTPTRLTRSTGGAFDLSGIEEAALTGGPGANTLNAFAFTGPVRLDGAAGNDSLTGGSGHDLLAGSYGADRLTGRSGDDVLDGGTGQDRLVEAANVDLTLTAVALAGLGEDSLASVELASLTGGPGSNRIDASAFPGAVGLNGAGGGDDLEGGPAGDVLSGGAGADFAAGHGGEDTMQMADGGTVDTADGGPDFDTCACDANDIRIGIP